MSIESINSSSFKEFEKSAYFLASKKYQTLKALNEPDIKFSYGSVSMKADPHAANPKWSFSHHYSSAKWQGRKILAIPCFLHSTVIKTINRVVRLILAVLCHMYTHEIDPLKRRCFELIREGQGAIGHFVTLFNDKVGSHLVQSSRFHLTAYALHGSKELPKKDQLESVAQKGNKEKCSFPDYGSQGKIPKIFLDEIEFWNPQLQRKIYSDLGTEIPKTNYFWANRGGDIYDWIKKDRYIDKFHSMILKVDARLSDEAIKGLRFTKLSRLMLETLFLCNSEENKEKSYHRFKLLDRDQQLDIIKGIHQSYLGYSFGLGPLHLHGRIPFVEWLTFTLEDFPRFDWGCVDSDFRSECLKAIFNCDSAQNRVSAVEYFENLSPNDQAMVFTSVENLIFYPSLKSETVSLLEFGGCTIPFLEKLFPKGTAQEKASSKDLFDKLSVHQKELLERISKNLIPGGGSNR